MFHVCHTIKLFEWVKVSVLMCLEMLKFNQHVFCFPHHPKVGIAIGFLLPPILVPNVDDVEELAYHISVMFYITAGVATLIFVLVVIGKSSEHMLNSVKANSSI
jgi:hypothetical protein